MLDMYTCGKEVTFEPGEVPMFNPWLGDTEV